MESELERLRKKVENFPSASLYNRLAELERLNGNGAEADTVCRKCIREFPRNGQAYVILAELQLAAGSRSEAQTLLHTAIERDARCYAGYRLLADLLVDGKDVPKDVPKAIWLLQQILTFKPNDPTVMAHISELERQTNPLPIAASATPNAPKIAEKSAANSTAAKPAPGSTTFHRPPLIPARFPTPRPARPALLDDLCAEAGVRGALIADARGRVVLAKNLPAANDELLAALAVEVAKTGAAALTAAGAGQISTWVIGAAGGHLLIFQRDPAFSVVILADPTVRPAMLELRARQTLIDLGGA